LAWLINHRNVIAIPRTSNVSHLKENAKAAEILLDDSELELLNDF
jgi:diketogulonate reductase-like aldo/keto reductase